MNVLLDHILYGVASRIAGNVRITARSAGSLGEMLTISISAGDEPDVSVDTTSDVIAIAVVIVFGVTKETDLVALINNDANAKLYVEAQQEGDDAELLATALAIVLTLGPLVAQWGLWQRIKSVFALGEWSDRDLQTTAEMQGLLFVGKVRPIRQGPDIHTFEGDGFAGLTISNKVPFEVQQVLLLELERKLRRTLQRFVFDVPYPYGKPLGGIRPEEGLFTNRTRRSRDEATGNVKQDSSLVLRTVVNFCIAWSQPAQLDGEDMSPVITGVDFGLWRVPIGEPLGVKELPTVLIERFNISELEE